MKQTSKPKVPKTRKKSQAHLKDEALFYEYAETKDVNLRNRLARNNQALVTYIVNKYYSAKKDHKKYREDLLQEGTIGLLSAIDGYKVELGFRFSTYATWWIRQAVNNYLINIEPMIHVPSHVRTQHNKIIRKLQEENRTFQSLIEDGIKSIEIDGNTVSEKMMRSVQSAIRSRYISSIDKPIGSKKSDSESGTLKDILPEDKPPLDRLFDQAKLVDIVRDGLKTLSDRERHILLLRFDVIDEKELTAKPNEERHEQKVG